MKVIAGIATFNERRKYLDVTIESLRNQVDEIFVYDNSINDDLTDNGKFYGLTQITEPCIYLSCDDDIIYPPNYADLMKYWLERLGGIVTHHGRTLKGIGLPYYIGHTTHACMRSVYGAKRIDVAGTGVTAFRTDVFNPIDIIHSQDKRMSDLVFSLEAAKQNVPIHVVPHSTGYFKDQKVPQHMTCFGMEHKAPIRQGEIADEIYTLRYGVGKAVI
jgi:hypothetical protein